MNSLLARVFMISAGLGLMVFESSTSREPGILFGVAAIMILSAPFVRIKN